MQGTILHVEDDDADHILFQRDLRQLNFEGNYLRAYSFEDAQQILRQYWRENPSWRPDLIVSDSKVGCYNALDVVQWLKTQPKLQDTPVVVYSTAIANDVD